MKRIISLCLCIAVIVTFGSTSFVQSGTIDSNKVTLSGDVHKFTSVDDETGAVSGGFPIGTKRNSGVIWTRTLYDANTGKKIVDTATATAGVLLKKEFVTYLSGSWAQASSYTGRPDNTATWTVSEGASVDVAEAVRLTLGLSKSCTTKYSSDIEIRPDKPHLFSKLGFASDFYKQYYYYTKYYDGKMIYAENAFIMTPADSYLVVYYK